MLVVAAAASSHKAVSVRLLGRRSSSSGGGSCWLGSGPGVGRAASSLGATHACGSSRIPAKPSIPSTFLSGLGLEAGAPPLQLDSSDCGRGNNPLPPPIPSCFMSCPPSVPAGQCLPPSPRAVPQLKDCVLPDPTLVFAPPLPLPPTPFSLEVFSTRVAQPNRVSSCF